MNRRSHGRHRRGGTRLGSRRGPRTCGRRGSTPRTPTGRDARPEGRTASSSRFAGPSGSGFRPDPHQHSALVVPRVVVRRRERPLRLAVRAFPRLAVRPERVPPRLSRRERGGAHPRGDGVVAAAPTHLARKGAADESLEGTRGSIDHTRYVPPISPVARRALPRASGANEQHVRGASCGGRTSTSTREGPPSPGGSSAETPRANAPPRQSLADASRLAVHASNDRRSEPPSNHALIEVTRSECPTRASVSIDTERRSGSPLTTPRFFSTASRATWPSSCATKNTAPFERTREGPPSHEHHPSSSRHTSVARRHARSSPLSFSFFSHRYSPSFAPPSAFQTVTPPSSAAARTTAVPSTTPTAAETTGGRRGDAGESRDTAVGGWFGVSVNTRKRSEGDSGASLPPRSREEEEEEEQEDDGDASRAVSRRFAFLPPRVFDVLSTRASNAARPSRQSYRGASALLTSGGRRVPDSSSASAASSARVRQSKRASLPPRSGCASRASLRYARRTSRASRVDRGTPSTAKGSIREAARNGTAGGVRADRADAGARPRVWAPSRPRIERFRREGSGGTTCRRRPPPHETEHSIRATTFWHFPRKNPFTPSPPRPPPRGAPHGGRVAIASRSFPLSGPPTAAPWVPRPRPRAPAPPRFRATAMSASPVTTIGGPLLDSPHVPVPASPPPSPPAPPSLVSRVPGGDPERFAADALRRAGLRWDALEVHAADAIVQANAFVLPVTTHDKVLDTKDQRGVLVPRIPPVILGTRHLVIKHAGLRAPGVTFRDDAHLERTRRRRRCRRRFTGTPTARGAPRRRRGRRRRAHGTSSRATKPPTRSLS